MRQPNHDDIRPMETQMKELPTPTQAQSNVNQPRGLLHPPAETLAPSPSFGLGGAAGLQVAWARHLDEVRQAQRLRHDVFAGEMGARLPQTLPGHDVDLFDDYCEHLLVRDAATSQVIGTYRVLTPEQAKRVGGFYSDTEFDLTRLRGLRQQMVELGRSCVHPDHRHGGVIMALWGALAEFMQRNQLDTRIGCAIIPLHYGGPHGRGGGGHAAASIWRQGREHHLASSESHVRPASHCRSNSSTTACRSSRRR